MLSEPISLFSSHQLQTQPFSEDTTPQGNIEIAASQIPPPGINGNFLAPVNDVSLSGICYSVMMAMVLVLVVLTVLFLIVDSLQTTNRRCQEWTMEYIRHLVARDLIAAEAIQIIQAKRDPPSHGIGLRSIGRNLEN